MQLRVGGIPLDTSFEPSAPDWNRLREPSAALLIASATLLAVVLVVVFGGAWLALLRPHIPDSVSLTIDLRVFALFAGGLVFLLVSHELLHAAALAGAGEGDTVLGVWPSHFVFYAHRFGEVGRARSVVVGLAPLVTLTVVPFALASVFPHSAGWLAVVSVANTAGSAADLIGVVLVLLGTPGGAVIRNQGYETWWRPAQQRHQPDSRSLH
jgi:hypothetical protein